MKIRLSDLKRWAKCPSYLFGRFSVIRRSYSLMTAFKQFKGAVSALEISGSYSGESSPLSIGSFGLISVEGVLSSQLTALRSRSFFDQLRLNDSAVDSLRRYAADAPLKVKGGAVWTYAQIKGSDELCASTAIGTVLRSSENEVVRRLAGDVNLLGLATAYLGFRPKRVSCWLFWSFANNLTTEDRRARDQTVDFHYDLFGWHTIYVSFYLTDTTRNNGAHILIENTHDKKRFGQLFGTSRLSDADAARIYGAERVRVLEGSAGFGFVEDPSCYHKALAPADGDRLMLQLRYQ